HAARLLRVYKVLINVTGMLESLAYRTLRDLVERDAANALTVGIAFFLFSLATVFRKFFREMRGDSFAFAVRVWRKIDRVGRFRQLLQPGEDLFFAGDNDVFRLEVVIRVDAEIAFGQIFDVTQRGFNLVALT